MAATMGIEGDGLKVSGDKSPCPATLLLIVGEPFTVDQKDLILERIVSELYAWDLEAAKCDVEEQLGAFAQQQPRGQDGPNGEKIFELKSDVLRVIVLLNPRLQTVREKIHSFLLTPSHYRHLLYSGLALHGTGCWILQDGIFTFSCLSELFQRTDVADALGHESDGVFDISTLAEGGGSWNEASLKKLAPHLKVRLNPPKSQRKEDGMVQFSDILSHSLKAPPCIELLQATDIVGNISFQRPTIYIFPAGRGDSALFGISGFNLLVNGGYCRRSCFWQFIRHLLRIDAIVVSHIAPDNIFGISSFFERKATEKTAPDLGVVYLNIGETKPLAPNGALPVSTGLVVSLADEGAGIVDHLRHIGMAVSPCTGTPSGQPLQSFNLYFKVGHGSLDLYVLNPLSGKDLSNFLSSWAKNINSTKSGLPLSDEQSVCSLLVWKPASPKEKVVRILFPGNAPQSKIFEGIERLKNVAVFQSVSGHVEKPAASGKVPEKKAAPVAGKPPVNKPAVHLTSDAEPKKPVISHVEQKPAAEHKEIKKPADHKEIRRTMDHKTIAKAETETKKAEGKQGPEHKEVRKISAVDSKRTSTAPHAAAAGEGKAAPAKQQDSTPGKQARIPEKAVKDAKNKKVAKETQEVKTPVKKTPVPKERAGATTPATPSGRAEKTQKKDETPAKSEGQKKEKAAGISAVTKAVKEPVLSQPAVAKPGITEAVVNEPFVTDPVVADPIVAKPVVADPVVAKPLVADPVVAKPLVADPVVAKPIVADPVVAKPLVADPVVAEPVVAEPVVEKPVVAEPVVADPIVAKPVVADPVVAKPVVADPVVAGPVVAEPVVAKPVFTEPVITEPVNTEPFFTEPFTEEEPPSHEVKELEFEQDHEKLAEVSYDDSLNLKKEEALDEKEFDFDENLVGAEEEEDQIKDQSFELEKLAASEEVKALPEFSLHAGHESLVATDDKFDKAEDSAGEDETEIPEALKSPVASVSKSTEEAVQASSLQSEELETPEKVHSVEAEKRIFSEEDHQVANIAEQLQPEPEKLESSMRNIEAEEELVHTEKQSHPTEQDLHQTPESAAALEDEADFPDDFAFGPAEKVETREEVEDVRSEQIVLDEDHSVPTEKELLEMPEKLESPKSLAPEDASAYTEKDLVETPEKGFVDREDFSSGDTSALFEKEFPKVPGQAEGIEDESFLAHRQKEDWVPMEEGDNEELAAVDETPLEDDDDWEEPKVHGKVSRKDHKEAPFDPEQQWGPPEGLPAPMNGKEGGSGKKGDQSLLHNTSVSGPKKAAATQLNASVLHGKKNDGKDAAPKFKRPATAEDSAKDKKVADDAAKLPRGAASAGPLKKAAIVSKPSVKDSLTKASHGLDSKKAPSKPVVPFFVDLTYIPSHGDLRRIDVDFFRTVRARYYVLSSPEPEPQVLSLLLDAKQSWENNSEVVTIIPTYDSDALTSWATENQDRLKKVNVEIAPSASRCTMQLQEREASCMAYRLEF